MSVVYTTNIINVQLNNLISCHDYKAEYSLHYSQQEYDAYLDKNTFYFRANNALQNAFVVLTKDTRVSNVLLEIKIFDLTVDNSLSNSSFIVCSDYNSCEL